jgi:hypothetical protein
LPKLAAPASGEVDAYRIDLHHGGHEEAGQFPSVAAEVATLHISGCMRRSRSTLGARNREPESASFLPDANIALGSRTYVWARDY